MKDEDNVIHVVFGRDGGHRVQAPTQPPPEPQGSPPTEHDDPLADLYTRAEVARLFGLSEGRLRYWDRTNFLRPSAKRGRRRLYTFQDLIGIRTAKGLLDRGVPLREVRRSVDALRAALPKVVRPLAELRVVAEGHVILVRDEDGTFEPQTGQLVLDFTVERLRSDVVRVLRREHAPQDRDQAYALYLEGCRLDEDPATFDEAEARYREAIRLDPALSNAITNLGNLRYRRGDVAGAEDLYQQALEVDPEQPEALYNLGFLRAERGDSARAAALFARALEADPTLADAHFHLALTLEAQGRWSEARPHWRSYLEFEPDGEWSHVAREHLGEGDDRRP